MTRLSIGGEDVEIEDVGSGPPVLLVHSLGTATWLWREQIRRWSPSHRVIALDARGHGRRGTARPITIEDNARDWVELIECLQLHDLTIVGLSMGGVIATHVLSLRPDRFRSAVLAGTFCRMPAGDERIAAIERQLHEGDMAKFGLDYARATLLPATFARHGEELAGSIAGTSANAYLATVQSLFVQDTRQQLAGLTVPMLVLVGDQDGRTPRPLAEEIARTAPSAELQLVADAAHLANLDNPAVFEHHVERFLATHAR